MEVSPKSLSHPRRRTDEGPRSARLNKIKMILLIKNLTNIIIVTMGKKTNLMYPAVMLKMKQKKEGRRNVK